MRRIKRFGEYTRIHWVRMRERDGVFCPMIIWGLERSAEIKGARDGIRELRDCVRFARDHGFLNILYAANSRNDAMISEWADDARLTKYLTEIVVRKKKQLKDVYGIVKKYNVNLAASFVVSSRLAPDIGFGNFLGFHTVWLKQGKEPDQPFNFTTRPEVIVNGARDFQNLLERFIPRAQTGSLAGLVPFSQENMAVPSV